MMSVVCMRSLLDELGSDDLARTAPRGEAVEDDELRALQGVLPVLLAVALSALVLNRSIVPFCYSSGDISLFSDVMAGSTHFSRLWTPILEVEDVKVLRTGWYAVGRNGEVRVAVTTGERRRAVVSRDLLKATGEKDMRGGGWGQSDMGIYNKGDWKWISVGRRWIGWKVDYASVSKRQVGDV